MRRTSRSLPQNVTTVLVMRHQLIARAMGRRCADVALDSLGRQGASSTTADSGSLPSGVSISLLSPRHRHACRSFGRTCSPNHPRQSSRPADHEVSSFRPPANLLDWKNLHPGSPSCFGCGYLPARRDDDRGRGCPTSRTSCHFPRRERQRAPHHAGTDNCNLQPLTPRIKSDTT